MRDCTNCKYRHPLKRTCMLGRAPSGCNGPTARRGDDGLYERVLTLTPDELAEARRKAKSRREAERRSKQDLGILRDSDWV